MILPFVRAFYECTFLIYCSTISATARETRARIILDAPNAGSPLYIVHSPRPRRREGASLELVSSLNDVAACFNDLSLLSVSGFDASGVTATAYIFLLLTFAIASGSDVFKSDD